jgi:hypothetical protein
VNGDDDPGGPSDLEVAMFLFAIVAFSIAFLVFVYRPIVTWPSTHPIGAYLRVSL